MADVSAAHVHIHLNVYPCGVRLFFSLSPSFPFPPFPKGTHIYLHLWGSDLSVIMHPVGQDKASEEDEYAGRHQACGNCKYRCVKCSPGCSAECSAVCSGDTLPPPPPSFLLYICCSCILVLQFHFMMLTLVLLLLAISYGWVVDAAGIQGCGGWILHVFDICRPRLHC